jgi:formate dehydrogenase gamma subunit
MDSRQTVQHAANTQLGTGILQQKLPDRLAEVLRRALLSTGGSGAAIALMHKDVMVTRARAGCAPDLGTPVNIHGSFAGLCVRTGRTLQSDHLQTDPRANGAAWRALNVSSMVVTPVRKGDAIVGILAVFSDKHRAFLPSHGVALEILALALDPTPPANHCPPPSQVRRTLESARAGNPPRSPHEPPHLPATTSAPLPVAAAPPQPLPVAPHPPCTAAHKPPQSLETTSAALPMAAVSPQPSRPVQSLPPAADPGAVETPLILRFRQSERMLHWSIAIPFLVCFTTAVILVIFYNPHPQRAYRLVFSLLHRISGTCLLVLPALVALRNRSDHRIHVYNIKEAFTWVADDVKWLLLMGAAALSSRITLPEQGKFNAAEKLNFIMVLCTYPVFISTGLILWRLHFAFAAWILHVAMAAMAAPLILGHIFMATINPETRVGLSGMVTGYVDRHWARHHYTRWYRQHFEGGPARGNHHGDKQARLQPPLMEWPSEAEG